MHIEPAMVISAYIVDPVLIEAFNSKGSVKDIYTFPFQDAIAVNVLIGAFFLSCS